jgi:RimJ/RimL family protein N-acetyltransferase
MTNSMKAKFVIRGLRASDKNDLIANELSMFDEAKKDINFGQILEKKRPTLPELRKWFAKCLRTSKSGESIDLVGVMDGKVVALCSVDKVGYGYETEHVGELGITIVKEGRGIGIGKAIVREILKKARKKYEIIEATGIFSTNKAAIRLYEGAGFKTCAVMPSHMKRGNKYFNEIRMSLRLK